MSLTHASEQLEAEAWGSARAQLAGLPGGGLNMADEAVDRHVRQGRGSVVALRFVSPGREREDLTYAQVAARSSQVANVLRDQGIQPGTLVCLLAGRMPMASIATLGALKAGCAVAPLFSAYGPEPIRDRLLAGRASILLTTADLYQAKIAPVRRELPNLHRIWLMGPGATEASGPGIASLDDLMSAASEDFDQLSSDPQAPAFVHFTSGTTGTPKGAVHVHEAIVAHLATGRSVLGLRDGDIYWCTADPGWVTGTSYGLIAPLACGVTSVIDSADFDPIRWFDILEQERVSAWYTSPTALRMLRKAGDAAWQGRDFGALRQVSSVGEPLNPEVISWGSAALGRVIHDTWWQTETGAIMIANSPGMDVRPGSMGRPVPGVEIRLARHGPQGERLAGPGTALDFTDLPDEPGEIAIRTPWPSMMRGYLHDPQRYQACFADGWYLSGDLARIDADGYVWFLGRGDDVIKTAGHLVGPFEVESALMEHPSVAEAGVVGLPDPLIGESICAFVTLRAGWAPSDALAQQIRAAARQRLGAAVAPRRIEFDASLPHTHSGKILRRELRSRALAAGTSPAGPSP
ncbi:MAG: acetate--CoA ligase [Actinomycetales bacterium]|nr:acetate--CoA ligase [Actinomycetales bacterium]